MSEHLVTGYAGQGHISSADAGCFNAGIFGEEYVVLRTLSRFEYTLEGNNTIKIGSGDLVMQGRHVNIANNSIVSLGIDNGTLGYNRIDVVAMRYSKNTNTGVESAQLVIVKGTETTGTPSAPQMKHGNIFSGELTDEMPLYEIYITDLAIDHVETVFSLAYSETEIDAHVKNKANPHRVTKAQVGLGNVENLSADNVKPSFTKASTLANIASGEKASVLWGKVSRAIASLISHLSNTSNPHEVNSSQISGLGDMYTKVTSSTQGAAKNAYKSLCSISLPAGTYIVLAEIFPTTSYEGILNVFITDHWYSGTSEITTVRASSPAYCTGNLAKSTMIVENLFNITENTGSDVVLTIMNPNEQRNYDAQMNIIRIK